MHSTSRRFDFTGAMRRVSSALSVALQHGLRVCELRRYYSVEDGEPVGPHWEMTFLPEVTSPRGSSRAQSLQSGFPPVPVARLCGGISLPGPHRVLS